MNATSESPVHGPRRPAELKPLSEISAEDRPTVGGKAYNCARLLQAGFPVPNGIVVGSDASEAAIRALPGDPWFTALPSEARFAVRSSGAAEDGEGHSFAGIHETQLNVARAELVEAILVCRRSANSSQAVAYRAARHLEDDGPSIGVLVQRMVPAVVSGVAFTVNPVSGANELVIETAPGLGEALVSGQVEPDEFVIAKADAAIAATRLGSGRETPTLTAPQLQKLAVILLRIEEHYGAPQDVEFCFDGSAFWIVQSRPVTTRGVRGAHTEPAAAHPATGTSATESSAGTHTQHSAPAVQHSDVEWTRANLVEVLPDQLSPQALALYEPLLDNAERRFFGRLMAPRLELGPIVKQFHGRLYFNLSQLRHVTNTVGAAFADTLRSLGHSERIRPEDEIARRPPVRQVIRALPDLVRLLYYDLRAERIFQRHEAMTESALARLRSVDPRSLTDREIWKMFDWWLAMVPETMTAVFVMSSMQLREDFLRKACAAAGFPYDRLVYPQLAAGERSVSSQQAVDLVALANVARRDARVEAYLSTNDGLFAGWRGALAGTTFAAEFERFLETYGHRGRYESDWSIPRLHEHPEPALFAIREQLKARPQDIRALTERQEADAAKARRDFEAKLTGWRRWTLRSRVRSTLKRLKKQYVWRERVRSDLTRVLSEIRAWHLALADRFVERGWIDRRDDYFLLELDEVRRASEDPARVQELRAIAARRAAVLANERDLPMPLFMREADLAALLRQARSSHEAGVATLTGLCVSPGSTEGEVVVMRDPREFAAMKAGAILVAPATDPSWTPLFTLASGVVVEVGGMLSHASTIAREYGLPALANVKNATTILKTGDRVRLDATAGRVERIAAAGRQSEDALDNLQV